MIKIKPNPSRPAFSMITAIFVMVLMATVGALILNISGKTVKDTTFQFRKEQAILLARSYTELAIMSATANESNTNNCTEEVVGLVGGDADEVAGGNGYKISSKISYVGNNLVCGTVLNGGNITRDRDIYIIVDTVVQYRDGEVSGATASLVDAPWISYRRRTTQKL